MKRIVPLKGRKTFQEVFKRGKRYAAEGVRISVLRLTRDREQQVRRIYREFDRGRDIVTGITISRKYGTAVERNKMKRRTRAIFRELLPGMAPGFITVAHYDARGETLRYAVVRDRLAALLKRAGVYETHED